MRPFTTNPPQSPPIVDQMCGSDIDNPRSSWEGRAVVLMGVVVVGGWGLGGETIANGKGGRSGFGGENPPTWRPPPHRAMADLSGVSKRLIYVGRGAECGREEHELRQSINNGPLRKPTEPDGAPTDTLQTQMRLFSVFSQFGSSRLLLSSSRLSVPKVSDVPYCSYLTGRRTLGASRMAYGEIGKTDNRGTTRRPAGQKQDGVTRRNPPFCLAISHWVIAFPPVPLCPNCRMFRNSWYRPGR